MLYHVHYYSSLYVTKFYPKAKIRALNIFCDQPLRILENV